MFCTDFADTFESKISIIERIRRHSPWRKNSITDFIIPILRMLPLTIYLKYLCRWISQRLKKLSAMRKCAGYLEKIRKTVLLRSGLWNSWEYGYFCSFIFSVIISCWNTVIFVIQLIVLTAKLKLTCVGHWRYVIVQYWKRCKTKMCRKTDYAVKTRW